jgi:hypothetical protein
VKAPETTGREGTFKLRGEYFPGSFERSLELAELSFQRSERLYVRSLVCLYLMIFCACWAALLLSVLGREAGRLSIDFVSSHSLEITGLVTSVLFLIIGFQYYVHIRSRRKTELRALYQIVELLRETEKSLAEKHKWSMLKRAQFRIRLARFEIGQEPSLLELFLPHLRYQRLERMRHLQEDLLNLRRKESFKPTK